MKKFLSAFLAFVLISGCSFAQNHSFQNLPDGFEYCYRVLLSRTEVRDLPALAGNIIFRLEQNEEIYIHDQKSTEFWYYCYIPRTNTFGWCNAKCFVLKPYFEDLVEKLADKDPGTVFMVENHETLPCQSISALLLYLLKDFTEEQTFFIVKLAVENNGILTREKDITNPLVESAKLNNYPLSAYLLQNGCKTFVNNRSRQYGAPLYWAVKNGNERLVTLLIENGATSEIKTSDGISLKEHLKNFEEKKQLSPKKVEKLRKLLFP